MMTGTTARVAATAAPRYYWMAVTSDEYELPLAVEESSEALGRLFGIDGSTVRSCVLKRRSGRNTGRRFVRVPFEGYED